MEIDLSNAWKNGARIINGAVSLLPNIVLAVLIALLFLFLASAAKSIVRRFTRKRGKHPNVGLLLGQLAQVVMATLGFLIALSAVAPSFQAGDLVKALGIGSVAIGFAFQNILQNFLAGILLLLQEPFQLGDVISVTSLEGRVDEYSDPGHDHQHARWSPRDYSERGPIHESRCGQWPKFARKWKIASSPAVNASHYSHLRRGETRFSHRILAD